MRRRKSSQWCAPAVVCGALLTSAAENSTTNQPASGPLKQIPLTPKGAPLPDEVRQKISASKAGQEGVQWFPATPPVLPAYLGNVDEFGNTAAQAGAVIPHDPLSRGVEAGKAWLSEAGLRYTFWQSLSMVSMTDVASGENTLQYYTATLQGKWAVFEAPKGGPAGWVSTEVNGQIGLSPASRAQSPQANLGTLVNPLATVFGPNNFWISELAWQQSLAAGKVVVLAGLVDQSNYLDANNYANNSQGQFLNSAFVNSMVLPLPFNNLGVNLQYQPGDHWYVMLGTGANNQVAGQSPFQQLGFDNWSYLFEFGLTPSDVLGLGAGNYRLQPYLATVGGQTQAGVGLNIGQQLGKNSPFAWFGRFGVGGSQVALEGARAQIASGFALQAPLKYAGLFPKLSNDYFGAGFVWSQPSAVLQPTAHANEYGFETTYVLQLTPTASVQPDFQCIWNPASNLAADHNLIFQLQLNLTW